MTNPILGHSLTRLRAFRASWNDGDVIDEESGLTAADLDVLIVRADQSLASGRRERSWLVETDPAGDV